MKITRRDVKHPRRVPRRFIVVVVPILMQILTGHWIVLLQYDEAAVSQRDGGGQPL